MVSGFVWLNDSKALHHLVQGELHGELGLAFATVVHWQRFGHSLTIFTSIPCFQDSSDWHTRLFTIWFFGSYVDLVLAIVIFVLYYWVLFGVKTLHLQVTINFAIQFRWQVHFLQYYVSLLRQQIIMVLNSCNKFLLQIFYFWASCRFSVLAFLFLKTVKNIINNISILKYIF